MIAEALRDAVADDSVAAIVLRVDSPGGSVNGSETIWREVVRAREAGKPVVVSMGSVAGSGGYYVAMSADAIIANPGTVTGSIGVLTGKFITKGLKEKLGVGSTACAPTPMPTHGRVTNRSPTSSAILSRPRSTCITKTSCSGSPTGAI